MPIRGPFLPLALGDALAGKEYDLPTLLEALEDDCFVTFFNALLALPVRMIAIPMIEFFLMLLSMECYEE